MIMRKPIIPLVLLPLSSSSSLLSLFLDEKYIRHQQLKAIVAQEGNTIFKTISHTNINDKTNVNRYNRRGQYR